MKNSILLFSLLFLISILNSSCDKNDLPMGDLETQIPTVSFTATPAANPNYIVLENTSSGEGLFSAWRYRAGSDYQRNDAAVDTIYYPEMGVYEITLLVGNDAGYDSLTTVVMVDQRDIDLPDPNADVCLALGDFEDGEVGGWNSWGQDVTVVDNPSVSAVNSSSKVLKMTQTDPFSQNANLTVDPSFYTPNAVKMTMDVYFDVAGSLKLQIESDFATGYFIDVPAGEWVTLEYDLQGQVASGGDYPWILLQGNTPGNFYVDNIKYCDLSNMVSNCDLLGEYESGEVGDWNAWGQDVTVVDNPSVDAVNASAKVLKMTQTDPFSTNANRSIPVITENATSVIVDVYFEVDGSLKLQILEDFATGYFQDVTAGSWVTLTYNLVGEVNDTDVYPWILIQGNTAGNFYLDNIEYCE